MIFGGILTALSIVGTGYSLVKEMISDIHDARKHFRKMKKDERKLLIKGRLEEQATVKVKAEIGEHLRKQCYEKLVQKAEKEAWKKVQQQILNPKETYSKGVVKTKALPKAKKARATPKKKK